MIKGIFFDLDGVLTTDKTGSVTTSKYFEKKLGINFEQVVKYKKSFDEDIDSGKMSVLDVWEKTCEKFGVEFSPTDLYEAFLSTPIDNKMVEYALRLKDKFIVGIITDNSVERARSIIEKNSWSGIFDVIIISEEIKETKKGTKIFEIAAQKANINPKDCIFIDNKQSNVDSAQKAGFIGVHFDDQIRNYRELVETIENYCE